MAEEFLTLMADLDGGAQARMAAWYGALREAGFTGKQTPGLPYHISLATFPLGKEQEAVEIMRKAGAAFLRFRCISAIWACSRAAGCFSARRKETRSWTRCT